MAETTYSYDVATDGPGGIVNRAKLEQHIRDSGILTSLKGVEVQNGAMDALGRHTAGDLKVTFNDALSAGDKTLLDGDVTGPAGGLIASHDNTPSTPVQEVTFTNDEKSPDGKLLVVADKSYQRKSLTIVSPNYADRHTWWHGSIRTTDTIVTAEVGTGGTQYQIPNLTATSKLINIYDITDGENSFEGYDPANYRVIIKKDDVALDTALEYNHEAGATTSPGGDAYQINYATGLVTFDADQSASTIKISFSRSDKGTFRLNAPAGYKLKLHHVELQFSVPHNTWSNPMQFVGGVNHAGTGNTDVEAIVRTYRGMGDIFNQANLGSSVPAAGEFTKDIYQIPFDYVSGFTVLPVGTAFDPNTNFNTVNYLELRMKYDEPFDSSMEIASATFYCLQEPL